VVVVVGAPAVLEVVEILVEVGVDIVVAGEEIVGPDRIDNGASKLIIGESFEHGSDFYILTKDICYATSNTLDMTNRVAPA
jgi:hypothetical protein